VIDQINRLYPDVHEKFPFTQVLSVCATLGFIPVHSASANNEVKHLRSQGSASHGYELSKWQRMDLDVVLYTPPELKAHVELVFPDGKFENESLAGLEKSTGRLPLSVSRVLTRMKVLRQSKPSEFKEDGKLMDKAAQEVFKEEVFGFTEKHRTLRRKLCGDYPPLIDELNQSVIQALVGGEKPSEILDSDLMREHKDAKNVTCLLPINPAAAEALRDFVPANKALKDAVFTLLRDPKVTNDQKGRMVEMFFIRMVEESKKVTMSLVSMGSRDNRKEVKGRKKPFNDLNVVHFHGQDVPETNWDKGTPTMFVPRNPNYPSIDAFLYHPGHELFELSFSFQERFSKC
jgi:hypothetical protein